VLSSYVPANNPTPTITVPRAFPYHQPLQLSLPQGPQQNMPTAWRKRPADGFDESSATAQNTRRKTTILTQMPSTDRLILNYTPRTLQMLNPGKRYEQGRAGIPSNAIQPTLRQNFFQPGSHDTSLGNSSHTVQGSKSPSPYTTVPSELILRSLPRIRPNGEAPHFHEYLPAGSFGPNPGRGLQQNQSEPIDCHQALQQTSASTEDNMEPSAQSQYSGHTHSRSERNFDARASNLSKHLSPPMVDHEDNHKQHGLNTKPELSFVHQREPKNWAKEPHLEPSLGGLRYFPELWTSKGRSNSDLVEKGNLPSRRTKMMNDHSQTAFHQPNDRAPWNPEVDAWLASNAGWDKFPMITDDLSSDAN